MKKIKIWFNQKFENYAAPTPRTWRKIGDSLLIISTTASTYSILSDEPTIAVIIALFGVVGKLLTNFNTETPKP
jgi:hypothetical protein